MITLQEVGGVSALPVVQNYGDGIAQITMHECNDIHDYHVFSCSELSSHLSQVILVSKDCVDHISGCWKGDRLLGVDIVCAGSMRRLSLVGCHLPHRDNSDEVFQASLREIQELQRRMDSQNIPCVIMGDFNAETSSIRGIQLSSTVSGRILQSFQPTRFGRCSEAELDFFMVNRSMNDILVPQAASVQVATIKHSHLALGSDHDCVCLELALKDPTHPIRRAKRKRYRRFKCRRHSVAHEPLHAELQGASATFAQQTLVQQWETLSRLSNQHSFASPSLKYRDPPGIKQLRQERRLASDPLERARVTRVIIAARHEARRRWMQDLYDKSEQGDPSAIRYLKHRGSQMPPNTEDFVAKSGGEQASIDNVKQHYSRLFGNEPTPLERESLKGSLQTLLEREAQCPPEPFTAAEVQPALDRLKRGKVSGMSGISNEFLLAVWRNEDGQAMLLCHLNNLLTSQDLPPDLLQAYVCLIPKTHYILECKDLRPINLLEVLHKVFAWLLISRLQQHWPKPGLQLGGLAGSQVADALLCAHSRVAKESREHTYGVWISCDVQAAFDSVSQSKVAAFVAAFSPDTLGAEAHRLLQLVMGPNLHFVWRGESWSQGQSTGVQQGGSHSALLFSYVLGLAVSQLDETWAHRKEPCWHDSYGWAYVDDMMFNFVSWEQCDRCFADLCSVLHDLGLRLNLRKTVVMSHPNVLRLGKSYNFREGSVVPQLAWERSVKYLKKPLMHFDADVHKDSTEAMLQPIHGAAHMAYEKLQRAIRKGCWTNPKGVLRLLNCYVGGVWFWLSPLLEPLQQYLNAIRTLQITIFVLMLGLYIPSSCNHNAAMHLHRLRRRVALLVLAQCPQHDWCCIWLKRRWLYLGHTLRQPQSHITRKAIVALNSVKAAVPSPWSHILSWGRQQLQHSTGGPSNFDELQHRASNKEAWFNMNTGDMLGCQPQHPIVHSCDLHHWRDALRVQTEWRLGASLHVLTDAETGSFQVTVGWLNEVEGMQSFTRVGEVQHVLHLWLQYLQFEFAGINVEFFLEQWIFEAFTSELMQLHHLVFREYSKIFTFQLVSREISASMLALQ